MYFDASIAANTLASQLCAAFLGFHVFTGCYSTSAFSGKEKHAAFSLLKKYPKCIGSFEQLKKYFKLPAIAAAQVQGFACKLYGAEAGNSNIDRVPCTVFCSPSKITQYSVLPTKDEFNLRIKGANCKAAIWRRSTTAYIDEPPQNIMVDC